MSVIGRTIDEIAECAHLITKQYSEAKGDFSQYPWDEAPEDQRIAARASVEFLLRNPQATPKALHNFWRRDWDSYGWLYGVRDNPEILQNPCMNDFDDLPSSKSVYVIMFHSSVRALQEDGTEE